MFCLPFNILTHQYTADICTDLYISSFFPFLDRQISGTLRFVSSIKYYNEHATLDVLLYL